MIKVITISSLLLALTSFTSSADTGVSRVRDIKEHHLLQIKNIPSFRIDVGDFPGVGDGELGHQLGCFIIHLLGYEAC